MSNIVELSPLVRRITAPNGGKMTGPGTNTYLIGHREIAVVDPGPAIDSHIDGILQAGGQNIRWVICTHTHPDHSPGAKRIVEATGAQTIGCVMEHDDGHQDTSFWVERNVTHGQLLETGEFTLEAIYTPGHVGNHFCYLLREEGMLFSGDHIMDGVSVVILPPSGDMKDFLDSIDLLRDYPITSIAPGHGNLITEPTAELDKLHRHRMYREQKVVTALEKLGESSLESLLPLAYDDVDPGLHKVARFSLWAHLLKLERDGVAVKTIEKHWAFGEEHWRLLGGRK